MLLKLEDASNLLGILLKCIISVRVLQRKRINRSVYAQRESYSKELAHEKVEASQAQNVQAGKVETWGKI